MPDPSRKAVAVRRVGKAGKESGAKLTAKTAKEVLSTFAEQSIKDIATSAWEIAKNNKQKKISEKYVDKAIEAKGKIGTTFLSPAIKGGKHGDLVRLGTVRRIVKMVDKDRLSDKGTIEIYNFVNFEVAVIAATAESVKGTRKKLMDRDVQLAIKKMTLGDFITPMAYMK